MKTGLKVALATGRERACMVDARVWGGCGEGQMVSVFGECTLRRKLALVQINRVFQDSEQRQVDVYKNERGLVGRLNL